MNKKHTLAVMAIALGLATGCQQNNQTQPQTPANPALAQQQPAPAPADTLPADAMPTPDTAPKIFKPGIVVPAGTIGYRVESAEFLDKLENGATPAANKKFLLVKLTLRNTGTTESALAGFKILDSQKREYLLYGKADKVNGSLNSLKQLGKDEGKNGVLVFEAPHTKGLTLQISSAPPVKDVMLVDLTESFNKK
jgi:hypothetical protein